MANPIETFADVLHRLIDDVLHGDEAEQAHGVVDGASGTRTPAPEGDKPAEPAPSPAVTEPQPAPDQSAPADQGPTPL